MFIEEISNHLKKDLIPFWSNLRDDYYGGYYGFMDNDLQVDKKAEKGAILHHRILWFFSNAYLTLGDESILDQAKHAYEFIVNRCLDKEAGGSFWSVTYDGKIKDDTKHTYCQAFMVYALASYYDASRDEKALETALELFNMIETKCCDDYGYLEAFNRNFEPIENDKLSENGIIAEKTMNTLLHVFEAYTELYRVSQDERVASKMKWILDIFMDKVYNHELHRQEVFFNKVMESIIDLHSYGHDIETAWLLDRGCEVLGDEAYTARVKPVTMALTKKIYERAYRENFLLNENENGVDDDTRVWWVQAESVIGFLNGYEKIKADYYLEASQKIWVYIKENFIIDASPSEWYSQLGNDDRPDFSRPLVEPWKCPYHNGRMCMEIMNRLSSISGE